MSTIPKSNPPRVPSSTHHSGPYPYPTVTCDSPPRYQPSATRRHPAIFGIMTILRASTLFTSLPVLRHRRLPTHLVEYNAQSANSVPTIATTQLQNNASSVRLRSECHDSSTSRTNVRRPRPNPISVATIILYKRALKRVNYTPDELQTTLMIPGHDRYHRSSADASPTDLLRPYVKVCHSPRANSRSSI